MDKEQVDDHELEGIDGKIKVISLSELIILGSKNIQPWGKVTPQTVYTICYTSGTTGIPKGAVTTHENQFCITETAKEKVTALDVDVYLSYMPLAHSFERAIINHLVQNTGKIGFYHGNMFEILEDLEVLKPTAFLTVPRILN